MRRNVNVKPTERNREPSAPINRQLIDCRLVVEKHRIKAVTLCTRRIAAKSRRNIRRRNHYRFEKCNGRVSDVAATWLAVYDNAAEGHMDKFNVGNVEHKLLVRAGPASPQVYSACSQLVPVPFESRRLPWSRSWVRPRTISTNLSRTISRRCSRTIPMISNTRLATADSTTLGARSFGRYPSAASRKVTESFFKRNEESAIRLALIYRASEHARSGKSAERAKERRLALERREFSSP